MQDIQAQQMMGKLPWDKAINVTCNCGNNTFTEAFLLKKFPKTLVETPGMMSFPTDRTIPIAVLTCTKCGTIQKEMLPPEITNSL